MDISSMLQYYNSIGVTGAANLAATSSGTSTSVSSDGSAVSFTSLLSEEVSELQEKQNLAAALDGTVVTGLGNLAELSTDMLRTSSGQKMLQELMNGQFCSVVTSSSEEENDEQTVSEAVLGTDTSSTSDYAQILEQLESAVDTMKTSDGKEE